MSIQDGANSTAKCDATFGAISADTAIRRRNPHASLPKLHENERLAGLAVGYPTPSFSIAANDSICTIGSCFARGVEREFALRGFTVPLWKFDIPSELRADDKRAPRAFLNKYNPYSMLNEIDAAFGKLDSDAFFLRNGEGELLDLQLSYAKFLPSGRAHAIRKLIQDNVRDAFASSRVVVVTLGLIECWYDRETGLYLNELGSPRDMLRHAGRFEFRVLGPMETIDATRSLIEKIHAVGPDGQKIIVSVSPVPLGRTFTEADVLTANGYSKSVLRVAAEVVTREFDFVDYFPSYESVMASERAVAWKEDYRHVTEATVVHNVGNMMRAYLDPEARAVAGIA